MRCGTGIDCTSCFFVYDSYMGQNTCWKKKVLKSLRDFGSSQASKNPSSPQSDPKKFWGQDSRPQLNLAMRSKYFTQISMFSSKGSSGRPHFLHMRVNITCIIIHFSRFLSIYPEGSQAWVSPGGLATYSTCSTSRSCWLKIYPQVVPRTGPAYGKRTVVLHAAQSNLRFNNVNPVRFKSTMTNTFDMEIMKTYFTESGEIGECYWLQV